MPNKAQFVDLLAERLDGDKKKAQAALDAVIDTIYQAVSKGERVVLTGFGAFEKRNRAARTARNPATGATVKVRKTSVPAFKPGAEFKAITSGAKKLARPAKKAAVVAKKAVAKATPSKAPAKRAPAAKKTTATKSTARKTTAAKKAPAKTAAKKAPAKKTTAKKTAAKRAR